MSKRSFKAQSQHDTEKRQRERVREKVTAAEEKTRGVRAEAKTTCAAAATTCAQARAKYKDSRRDRDAVRELAREYRLIRRAELARARPARRGPSIARVTESDDEVRQNIPREFRALWEREKNGIRGSARRSRSEAFMECVEEHPEEVIGAIEIPSDDEYAAQWEAHARRASANPGHLIALGWVSRLETTNGKRVVVPRRTLLAYDPSKKRGGLVLVFDARTSRAKAPASAVKEYKRTHWGEGGAWGISSGEAPELPPRDRKGVPLMRVVYTTKKGGDRGLVDYDHAFEGTLPVLVRCAQKRAQIHGGSYRVTERGIVG